VAEADQPRLLALLQEALPFYEEPGDLRIRLLRSRDDPERFIEVVEYQGRESHDRDQLRVASDPRMRALLERWHGLFTGPLEIETYQDVPEIRTDIGGPP
jgi:quinol monooxygenase YgiN